MFQIVFVIFSVNLGKIYISTKIESNYRPFFRVRNVKDMEEM